MGVELKLGGLQEILGVYSKALGGKVKAKKKDGTLVAADAKAVQKAITKLNEAASALTDVCQQEVLAVDVEG